MLHYNILNQVQTELLPLIKEFGKEYYLVGGTAIALQIGHRRSIDFDLFKNTPIDRSKIKRVITGMGYAFKVGFEDGDQLTGVVNEVQLTFYEYPHKIPATVEFDDVIVMPDLLDLAAMKAFALGKRAKWRDYVDAYFILRDHYSLAQISLRAEKLFQNWFNEKLFRQQLSYFDDIDYRQKIAYLGESVPDEEVKAFLIDVATQPF